jgi:putative peptidoglycan lipid II flippase
MVCVAAQLAATLQSCGKFAWPALAPCLLNIVWLLAAWLVAPRLSDDPFLQTYVLAAAILVSGVLQLAVQWPALRSSGLRFQLSRQASHETVAAILPAMGPTLFALAVTRINTLCDSLIAWSLALPGAAGAVYCAERLCHFPIGLLGVTVATVVFPRLSRHAAVEDRRALTADLVFGLRLVLLLAIPASAGLWLLAEPLTTLLFARGEFTAHDAWRTAQLVRGYSIGTCACCALPLMLRVYYALGDRRTPLVIGMAIVTANVALNLLLIGPLGEVALALSTSACAMVQCLLLGGMLLPRLDRPQCAHLLATSMRTLLATAAMYLAGRVLLEQLAEAGNLVKTSVAVGTCVTVYAALLWRAERSAFLAYPERAGAHLRRSQGM